MINPKNIPETLTPVSFIPDHKPSHEEYTCSLKNLCLNTMEKYNDIMSFVSNGSVSKKGLKAAKHIQKKYGSRLEELCAADFTKYTEGTISDYYSEISSIITALRGADELIRQQ